MSDVSVLSHEYKTVSELSQFVGGILIPLKKVHYCLPGITDEEMAELEGRSQMLADVLTRLRDLLAGTEGAAPDMAVQIPGTLVARLQRGHGGELPYYVVDLERVAARLRSKPFALDEEDLRILDEIAAATDAEASRVFRQMMRR